MKGGKFHDDKSPAHICSVSMSAEYDCGFELVDYSLSFDLVPSENHLVGKI